MILADLIQLRGDQSQLGKMQMHSTREPGHFLTWDTKGLPAINYFEKSLSLGFHLHDKKSISSAYKYHYCLIPVWSSRDKIKNEQFISCL